MYVYRITHQKRASDLQGTGELYTSGRWHRKGTRLLYTAQSIALAKIEALANTSGKVPEQQVLITLEIRDDSSMLTLSAAALPNNWHYSPICGTGRYHRAMDTGRQVLDHARSFRTIASRVQLSAESTASRPCFPQASKYQST